MSGSDTSGGRIFLGVNIDHVATLRQARGTPYPDLATVTALVEDAGADAITLHLREDRRHIQESDVETLRGTIRSRMNLEMAIEEGVMRIAEKVRPEDCCMVPEKREELTTEGGLDVAGQTVRVREACARMADSGIRVSLFIDPDPLQIDAAAGCGAPCIELHTGDYANARGARALRQELERIVTAAAYAQTLGLQVNAGHGLDYVNVAAIAAIPQVAELNIGHAIVCRAVVSGIGNAVTEMKRLMLDARAPSAKGTP